MKILLVITKSEIGGAQVFVLNLARALQQAGLYVEVAAGEGNFLFEELQKHNISYHYLNSLKRDFSVLNSFYFIFDLHRLLKRNNYDIVHLNSSNTLFGAISTYLLKKKPRTLFTFHGLSLLDKNYKTSRTIKFLAKVYFRFFLQFVDKTVFVSKLNFDESNESGFIRNIEVIYNGLDEKEMSFLCKDEARKYFCDKCGTDFSDSFLIGTTGRLAYQKNYEFLINNFSLIKEKIPEAKIIIIGEGPNYDMFSKKICTLGIANDFFLVGPIKESYRYIKAFDVFTLPSRYEGLSISLIEAIFADIPILASDVGGNSEIVGNGSNQLFRLDDPIDYVLKLLEIHRDRNRFIESNSKLKGNFSIDKMVRSYRKLYEIMVG
ncbi:MAG: glycosyltransferase [Bacteroidota bacterium]